MRSNRDTTILIILLVFSAFSWGWFSSKGFADKWYYSHPHRVFYDCRHGKLWINEAWFDGGVQKSKELGPIDSGACN
jgi:hypothetical protein